MLDFLSTQNLREFSPGSEAIQLSSYDIREISKEEPSRTSLRFRIFKFCFDYGAAIVALPLIAAFAVILFIVNPFVNPGPLFFSQERMGRDGSRFRMYKFRTMTKSDHGARDPEARLEKSRITPLGRFMRKTRIDELPNFFNVLRGEMSVVGPRPDAYAHAAHFSQRVVGYAARHRVKPGITGLAQVEMGYAEGEEATKSKAHYDNIYVNRVCGRLDLYVIRRTFLVMFRALGA